MLHQCQICWGSLVYSTALCFSICKYYMGISDSVGTVPGTGNCWCNIASVQSQNILWIEFRT